jgi:hypothetical protein
MDLRKGWMDIIQKHDKALREDLEDLLKKAVPYLKSVGYDLDLKRSYLEVRRGGSDGPRMSGALVITEREENTVQAPNAESIKRWMVEALDLHGFPQKVSEGPQKGRDGQPLTTWVVDIDES